jgi:hypothetical protein
VTDVIAFYKVKTTRSTATSKSRLFRKEFKITSKSSKIHMDRKSKKQRTKSFKLSVKSKDSSIERYSTIKPEV